ncbi:MAG: hypothetical protein IPF42_07220 [Candidatus Microthrix sp.]|nr:hypothetical protein [Candidatus Microthrix sp.]
MALTNKSRTAIYSGLTDIIDEDAVEEMLTNFPARDTDEPVTGTSWLRRCPRCELNLGSHGPDNRRPRDGPRESRIPRPIPLAKDEPAWMVGMMIAVPAVTVALQAFIK